VHIRWNRQRLKTNRQVGEFLCPHFNVLRPWIRSPALVQRVSTGGILTIWNPGPSIRECCLEQQNGFAFAAWWWEVKNRFEDLVQVGLADPETTQALIEQLDLIEEILEERVPKPSKEDWKRYADYREDLSLTKRRMRTPLCVKQLGLSWPFSKEELSKRWGEIVLLVHPDKGGTVDAFQLYHSAYKSAKALLERKSA